MATPHLSPAPRIVHLGDRWVDDRPGGGPRYLADLVAAERRAGLDARAVVVGPASGAPPWVEPAAALDQPLARRLVGFWAASRRIDVDLVDSHFALYTAAALCTTKLRRRPVVVHFHGPWADEGRVEGDGSVTAWAKRSLERFVYRRADRFVVLSDSFGDVLTERYGVPIARVERIRPGVDVDMFAPGPSQMAHETRTVCTVRRLVPRMGLDVLLDAWSGLCREVDGVVLEIVGDGPSRVDLEDQAERLGIAQSVRFLGRVTDAELVGVYRRAELSVVPSVAFEGYGLIVLESLACGTPVVGSDIAGLSEAIGEFDRSLLVPPHDPVALAERLIELLSSPDGLPSAEACRCHAENHGWDRVAERHDELYRAVLNERRRVVFVDHTAVPGGAEVALVRTVGELATRRPVTVILGADGPIHQALVDAGATVEIIPIGGAGHISRERFATGVGSSLVELASWISRVARRLVELRPAVVHTNTMKANVLAGIAARAVGAPLVWHVRDRVSRDYYPRTAVAAVRTLRRVLPTAVIANSPSTLSTLPAQGGLGVSVPSPLSRPAIVGPNERQAVRTVTMIGRLAPWKGQDVFLRAFAEAFPDGGVRAEIVGGALFGEDDWAAHLRRLADELGLEGRIEFSGHVDDVRDALARADILVHASTTPEPFGLVIVEAMAAGVPVVASDQGGPADTITDGVDGLLHRMGDAGDLSEKLQRLAGNSELRRSIALAAMTDLCRYEPATVCDQLEAVYEAAAGGRRWSHWLARPVVDALPPRFRIQTGARLWSRVRTDRKAAGH